MRRNDNAGLAKRYSEFLAFHTLVPAPTHTTTQHNTTQHNTPHHTSQHNTEHTTLTLKWPDIEEGGGGFVAEISGQEDHREYEF